MPIRRPEDVASVLALFSRHHPHALVLSDDFARALADLHVRGANQERSRGVFSPMAALNAEYATLLTILERNEWQKRSAKAGDLNQTSWLLFSTLDVKHYFISLRSLFDHLAAVCEAVARKRKQCPRTFDKLLTWCQNDRVRADEVLGSDVVEIITECEWFLDVRNTRDGIVHFAALTLAFPSPETVSFKVYAGDRSSVVPDELMTNENVADFELYMAWTLGNLLVTMDCLGRAVLRYLGNRSSVHIGSYRTGFETLYSYLERLSKRLRERAVDAADA